MWRMASYLPIYFFTISVLFRDFEPMHVKVTVDYRGACKKRHAKPG